jgi:hypothetical protein
VQSRELVDWIEFESFWFDCPSFADELVGRESFEGLQSPSEIVGADEAVEMPGELILAVVGVFARPCRGVGSNTHILSDRRSVTPTRRSRRNSGFVQSSLLVRQRSLWY